MACGIRSSDDWDFSSEPVLNLGWLDRVHRGTPWQTIYFDASAAGSEWLYSMGGPASTWDTHPTNDWRLISAFLRGELLPGVVQPSAPILVNNTIVGCTAPMGGSAIHVVTNVAPVVVNNIVTGNTSGLASDNGPLAGAHHNLIWGNATFDYAGTPSGPADVAAPPMLVGAVQGRFELLAGSPCIDAGDESALSSGWTERAGPTAVQSGRIDLGAYEFGPDGVPVLGLVVELATNGISWTVTGFAGECYVAEATALRLRISTSATSLGSRKVGSRGSPLCGFVR